MCLPDLAVVQSEEAVQEHQEADQGGRKQHPSVPAEPGEVQADLLPEIPPETAAVHKRNGKLWTCIVLYYSNVAILSSTTVYHDGLDF